MSISWRFGERSPWCFYCGTYNGEGLVDLRQAGEWLGRICPACLQGEPRQAADRARARATEFRNAAEQLVSLPRVQEALREYASLLEGLAEAVERLAVWP